MASYHFNVDQHLDQIVPLLQALEKQHQSGVIKWENLVKTYPKASGEPFTKEEVRRAYLELAGQHGLGPSDPELLKVLITKPVRSLSGVTPVTVLTKPFPCPGKCIFCPNDIRMPKSYLANEPGAQRAERNWFDPYLQTYNRLQALQNIGHPVDKIEIIILGGTWSYYPEAYQIWFIKECFRALNEFGHHDGRPEVLAHYQQMAQQLEAAAQPVLSDDPQRNQHNLVAHEIDGTHVTQTYNQVISHLYVAPERKAGFDKYQTATWEELEDQQLTNESAAQRSVGLVIETRPDNISVAEVKRVRRLGATKTQIGVQSLNDQVLKLNNRGHDVAATRQAFKLLRQAGFKIHAHWMANLHGSSPDEDITDFAKLFSDPDFHPDELKIYPCSLIGSAELMAYHQRGEWQPYTKEELLKVVSSCLTVTPAYCRLTRVIRDIPSTDIVTGNKLTNFRQLAESAVNQDGQADELKDIRSREIRNQTFDASQIHQEIIWYDTSVSREAFIQWLVPVADQGKKVEKILGFLRLSLPLQPEEPIFEELKGAAMVRELHIYGQAVNLGHQAGEAAQHLGLGKKLLATAAELCREAGFEKLAVISAIGTKAYYRKQGFTDGDLYQFMSLPN